MIMAVFSWIRKRTNRQHVPKKKLSKFMEFATATKILPDNTVPVQKRAAALSGDVLLNN